MQIRTALLFALPTLLLAGCAGQQADLGAPYVTSAGPAAIDNETAEVRQIMEVIRPQALGQF